MDREWVRRAGEALAPYDAADLAATVGALQLVPDNAGRLFGLEAAAAAIARLSADPDRPSMSASRWRRLLNAPDGALCTGVADEDPFENPFVDELVHDGRAYRYLPGLPDESLFVLRHLLRAIDLMDAASTARFVEPARRLVRAALAIGDEVCRRADLGRGCPPGASVGGPVVVPVGAHLGVLKRAVRIAAQDLEALLASHGAALDDLDSLVAEPGPSFPEAQWANLQPALALPILRLAFGEHVVVGPQALVPRLRHALVRLAMDRGAIDALAAAFRSAAFGSVVQSLQFLGADLLRGPIAGDLDGIPATGGFFGLDTDKVVHTLVISDDLRSYDRADPLGEWPLDGLSAAIERRLASEEDFAFATQPRLREMLHLVLLQGVGRFYLLRPAASLLSHRSRRLTLTAADLSTIGFIEGGTRLRLWQFAGARTRLRSTATVAPVAVLDEYDVWRDKGYGYYFGDDCRPNFVSFAPGGAGNLRHEVQRKRDFHGVLDPASGAIVEVTRVDDDPEVPIYFPWTVKDQRVRMLADVPSGPYWVVGPADPPDAQRRHLYAEIAEMLAYWLWQFDPGLLAPGTPLGGPPSPQVIHLEIDPSAVWFSASPPSGDQDSVRCERLDPIGVRLRLGPGAPELFASPDNAGERHLLRILLESLGEAVVVDGVRGRRALSAERVDELIEMHAPLGLKKKFFLVPGGADPRLSDQGLPPFRPVQEPDEEMQLDEVGEYVQTELGYSVGPIPDEQRTAVLRGVVASRFAELEAQVATLDHRGLLKALVEHHEAILTAQALRELTTPTQRACFGATERFATQLSKELREAAQAATASRVLIEYVTARPPAGDRPLSLAAYDRLLAVISHLQQWAFTSDEIYYGLVDHPLEMLPSGRLGMERSAYVAAHAAFSGVRVLGEVGRGTAAFGRHWRDPGDRAALDDEALARATAEEFGLPLGRLVDFLWAVIAIGRTMPGAAKVMAEGDLRVRLAAELGWSDADVRIAVELFAARPRADFWAPSPPYSDKDAAPWNYTRALSYLRKPLLVRSPAGDETVLWGDRNVFLAGMTFVSLCLGGRYQPKTKSLQRIMGRQREVAGQQFNDEVATLFERIDAFTVRRRFKKAGKLRIQRSNGQTLGDIDILVADRARRRFLAVEAKNLAGARTPAEFIEDVHEVLEPRGERSASIDKHLERVAWLRTHRSEVLEAIGLPTGDADRWTTEALVVVNIESLAPFLVPPRVRVVSFAQLVQEIGEQPGA